MIPLRSLIALGLLALANPIGASLLTDFYKENNANCPVPMRYNVSCPALCVPDLDLCPTGTKPPACPQGQTFCQDGTCKNGTDGRAACSNARPCACSHGFKSGTTLSDKDSVLFPCLTVRVNVPNYAQNDIIGDAPLLERCRAATRLASTDQTMRSPFFLQCAAKPIAKLTFTEPEFLAFYLSLSSQIVILLCYEFYRRVKKRSFFKRYSPSQFRDQDTNLAVVSEQDLSKDSYMSVPINAVRMSGFKSNYFGMVGKSTLIHMSVGWILILGILIGDYYGMFVSLNYRDGAMLFNDRPTLSKAFVALWHITTFWFLFLQMQSTNLLTYFLADETLDKASDVLIEKKIQAQTALKGLGPVMKYILSYERVLAPGPLDVIVQLVPVQATQTGRRYIEFECARYVYNGRQNLFEPFEWSIGPTNQDIHAHVKGLTSEEAVKRQELVGKNEIAFKVDSFWAGIWKEFTGIFYIYQLMQIIIWYYYAYYYMALVVNVVIVVSGVVKVVVARKAQAQILGMARFSSKAKILRDEKWIEIDSEEMVPGDIFQVQTSDRPVPADCLLLQGGVVMDESSLTGEALPVAKFALKNDIEAYDTEDNHNTYYIHAGCKILEVKPADENTPVLAFVTATGAATAKGHLVRDILYPVPFRFIFTEHLKVVVAALLVWGFVLLLLSMYFLDTMDTDSWFYGMTSISQILSPLLPAVLVMGQSIATERLRKKGIMCLDLNRITLAGKVKLFCFDKTGTLTKEGLDFMGTQEVFDNNTFGEVKSQFPGYGQMMKRIMLTCHSLTTIGDRFVGNFVDIEMFRVTSGNLYSGNGSTSEGTLTSTVYSTPATGVPPLRIIKRFEFSHKHAYMSVIVRDPVSGRLSLFLKGSCEKIKELVMPGSLPSNFDEIVKQHSSRGYYVIAVAATELPAGTSTDVAIRWPRELLEKEVQFVGLMLFRNEVKPDTGKALSELRAGGCRVSMITGDNVNTAIYIGWASGMIKKDWQKQDPLIVVGEAVENKVVWKNTEDNSTLSYSVLDTIIQRSRKGFRPVEIAINGKAFHILLSDGWLHKNLLEVRIFASMKPMDKVKCVRLHMERGITAMCGDGGNDAGALKAAHTGVALSDADASVVGHFSSKTKSINACVDLLREARCSLDVSFASYKYLMMYGEILAFIGMVQYLFRVNISQAIYIMIDGTTVPLSWALTMAVPTKILAETRPTARLFGAETVLSIVGQIVIDVIFMIIAIVALLQQEFYKCKAFDFSNVDLSRWWELADNYEAQVSSLMLIFQIFHAAAALNIGSKYRQGTLKNWKFVTVYGIFCFLLGFIALADPNPLGCLFRINCGTSEALQSLGYKVNFTTPTDYHSAFGHNVMPLKFRMALLSLSFLNLLAVLAWEGIVIQGAGRKWALRRWRRAVPDYRN